MTGYGPNDSGSVPGKSLKFSRYRHVQTGSATEKSYPTGFSAGVIRQVHQVNHPWMSVRSIKCEKFNMRI
jgi:hypothetical protein